MNKESRLTRLEKVLGFNTTAGERARVLLAAMPVIASLLEKRFPKAFSDVIEALAADPGADRWGLTSAMVIVFEILGEYPAASRAVGKKVLRLYQRVPGMRARRRESPTSG